MRERQEQNVMKNQDCGNPEMVRKNIYIYPFAVLIKCCACTVKWLCSLLCRTGFKVNGDSEKHIMLQFVQPPEMSQN